MCPYVSMWFSINKVLKMSIPKPIITKEHGSWAVLFVPMVVGAAYTKTFSWNVVWLALSALGVFMSYVPVHTLLREFIGMPQGKDKVSAARFWAVVYLACGVLFVLPLLYQQLWLLFVIGIFGAVSFFGNFFLTRLRAETIPVSDNAGTHSGVQARKIQKSVASDLTAVAGLALSAPAAYYVTTGKLDMLAVGAWLLNVLFFGCSVFYAHLKIHASKLRKDSWQLHEKWSAGKSTLLYHVTAIGLVRIMVVNGLAPFLSVLAFAPMFFHAVIGTAKIEQRVKFKNLGFMLLGHSVVYGAVLILLMR